MFLEFLVPDFELFRALYGVYGPAARRSATIALFVQILVLVAGVLVFLAVRRG